PSADKGAAEKTVEKSNVMLLGISSISSISSSSSGSSLRLLPCRLMSRAFTAGQRRPCCAFTFGVQTSEALKTCREAVAVGRADVTAKWLRAPAAFTLTEGAGLQHRCPCLDCCSSSRAPRQPQYRGRHKELQHAVFSYSHQLKKRGGVRAA